MMIRAGMLISWAPERAGRGRGVKPGRESAGGAQQVERDTALARCPASSPKRRSPKTDQALALEARLPYPPQNADLQEEIAHVLDPLLCPVILTPLGPAQMRCSVVRFTAVRCHSAAE